MEKTDKITIIMPVYNVEKYIERALKSAINQTYKNLEIIVVNDGSTDNSENIILKYVKEDDRIVYLKQQNAGQGSARNNAINIATGKYIFFLDSDDFMEVNAIEYLYNTIEKESADMIICNYYIYNESNNSRKEVVHYNSSINTVDTQKVDFMKNQYINHKYENHPWDKLYKTSLIKNNKIEFESRVIEDVLFNMKIYPFLKKIVYINEPLYNYCIRNNSTMGTYKSNFFDIYLDLFNLLEKYAKNNEIKFSYQTFYEYNIYILLMLCAVNQFSHKKYKGFIVDVKKLFNNPKLMEYNNGLLNNLDTLVSDNKKIKFLTLMCKYIQRKKSNKLFALFFLRYKLMKK